MIERIIDYCGRHKFIVLVFAGVGRAWRWATGGVTGHAHEHAHHHIDQRYGTGTAYSIGLLHGIGAETGTQVLIIGAAVMELAGSAGAQTRTLRLSRAELQDRIRGGWAGQTIGVTFGAPPALGVEVTADFEFDVPARFDTDHMAVTIETYLLHNWPPIPIVEFRG